MRAKRKVIYFAPDIITDWIVQDSVMPTNTVRCIQGIPEGARFVRGFYDGQINAFGAIYEHESWEEVEDGNKLPEITVLLTSHYETRQA